MPIGGGNLLLFGGYDGENFLSDCFVLHAARRVWCAYAAALMPPLRNTYYTPRIPFALPTLV